VAVAALAVGMPLAALTDSAIDLLKQGFSHRDVGPAFDAVLDQAREELAVDQATQRLTMRRVLGGLTVGSFSLPLISAALMMLPGAVLRTVTGVFGFRPINLFVALSEVGLAVGVLAGIGYLATRARLVEPEGAKWARVWKGRIGRAIFAVASRFVKGGHVAALTHRATELSLGMAAEQLYESLPGATRRQLADLPGTLRHLQDAAQELRRRRDSLADALADAGDAIAGAEYADVRAMRDALHDKLGDTVGALETIRLNLLRLHAGSLSVESVTTHLGLAAEVSEEVERLIAAHEEVNGALRFPRPPAVSPV
jgi:serine/threonine-protein kinase